MRWKAFLLFIFVAANALALGQAAPAERKMALANEQFVQKVKAAREKAGAK